MFALLAPFCGDPPPRPARESVSELNRLAHLGTRPHQPPRTFTPIPYRGCVRQRLRMHRKRAQFVFRYHNDESSMRHVCGNLQRRRITSLSTTPGCRPRLDARPNGCSESPRAIPGNNGQPAIGGRRYFSLHETHLNSCSKNFLKFPRKSLIKCLSIISRATSELPRAARSADHPCESCAVSRPDDSCRRYGQA